MRARRTLPLIFGLMVAAFAFAEPPDETRPGENVERHLSGDQPFGLWSKDPKSLEQNQGDRLETRKVPGEKLETIKLHNVVPPIHFESGVAKIPPDTVDKLARILDSMRYRKNVRVHFVGHADSQKLSAELARQFGDNAGLSRERAGEVAEYFKKTLGLPPEAITYEWMGETEPVASNDTEEGRALNRRVEVEVWYDEVKAATKEEEVLVSEDSKRIKVCRTETVCKLRYKEGQERRARVRNLIVPLRYEDDTTPVSDSFVQQVGQAVAHLHDKQGLKVKFIGYTDTAPLSGRDQRIYGDALALSKARARRVALAVKDALKLPTAAIDSDGRGAAQPVASNDTAQGRALNRRVEVEFWYDDPLQELPDEPQMCPGEGGQVTVTKVYDPPWGTLAELELRDGQPILPDGYAADLHHALADIADRTNARLRFIGYTKNERLERRTAEVYGDDVGLSAARARRAMELLLQDPQLSGAKAEHEGRGYVQSDDVVNSGFVQGERSFVRVQAVYDEPVPLDDLEGVDITPMTRVIHPQSPYELNTMRITVDGKPIDDPGLDSSDIQRCTDVELDKAKIRFHFDNLDSKPRLAAAAHPVAVSIGPDGAASGPVRFRTYDNYASYIKRREIRIFDREQSHLQAVPLAVIPVDDQGEAEWQPPAQPLEGPVRELKFVLRAYDAKGHFDETEPHTLWLVREASTDAAAASAAPESDATSGTPAAPAPSAGAPTGPSSELLAAYGESDLVRHQIPMGGGTIRVQGGGIPAGHTVWVAGRQVPVDPQGNFIAEEILPDGAHTVEVSVLDEAGNGSVYLRDLEFKRRDFFYVGVADLTVSDTHSHGPVEDLQGNNAPQPFDSTLDGRLAFFVDGKLTENWHLTTSADTREAPVNQLFTNFLDKTPDSLFRRMDPDYHWPTYGDDSSVDELAPTYGKFYVKARRDQNYAMWGNFKVGYLDNEMAQVDRGLYGADAHYESQSTTSFGERKAGADGFAADPGTVGSFEELRGTGGSLYYLHHQDILTGSERVRIEIRDKDSQIVKGTVDLRPGIDYDVDYIQGRVLLSEPLSSIASDNQLVRTSGLSGDEAFLVVRYEYTPGFGDLSAMSTGGQGHYWFGDHVRLGLTANSNTVESVDSKLGAADLTLRKSTETYFKILAGRSEGAVSTAERSDDGGFGFAGDSPASFTDAKADSYRAEASVGFGDHFNGGKGRLTLYSQNRDAGYSAPNQSTLNDIEQYGGAFRMPIGSHVLVAAKGDQSTEDQGLEHRALELDLGFKLTDRWTLSTGVRDDNREDHSPVVPLTQEQGERTDAVAQLAFDSGRSWRAYAFGQETVSADAGREDNARYGAGGSYRLTKRFKLDGEVSDGDLGAGGRLGTSFLATEKTNLYLNYLLENDRTDAGVPVRQGSVVTGVKQRFMDSSSVYMEERYHDVGSQTGLTHAAGVNLVEKERWNFGVSAEVGTLVDARTSAQTDRHAAGVHVGYNNEIFQLTSGVEYRHDDTEQPDTTQVERNAWLFRNAFKVQLTPDWRLVGKYNHSFSDSSLGDFYGGGYTESVLGYAYRPVRNDRFNALAKFTWFTNTPTTGQVGAEDAPSGFIQKSRIASLDLGYDLTSTWSIGGKYAYRLGQVSLDRVNPVFFDNAAHLIVLRADWRFLKHWELMAEGRALDLPDIDQRRSGALGAVYMYLGKYMKMGAGYNFTDFSDDLTDLSYDHRGVFFNVIGSM
jgi:flagellar motor protein MotB